MVKLLFFKRYGGIVGFVLISFAFFVYASQNGKVGATRLGATQGCTCHGSSPAGDVSVTISGPDTLTAGETAAYSVRISGGPLAAAGTNIAISSGELMTVDSELRKENGELTHSGPKPAAGSSVRFDFNFTAPAVGGSVTMAANGNSVNLNGSSSGDAWNFAENKTIVVRTTTGLDEQRTVAESFILYGNYPNPFNPATMIRYRLTKSGPVRVEVFNAAGKKVAVPFDGRQDAGDRQVMFNALGLSAGTYYYRVVTGEGFKTGKMVLIK